MPVLYIYLVVNYTVMTDSVMFAKLLDRILFRFDEIDLGEVLQIFENLRERAYRTVHFGQPVVRIVLWTVAMFVVNPT